MHSLKVMAGVQPDHADSDLNNFEDRYSKQGNKKLHGQIMSLAKDIASGTLLQRFVFLLGRPGVGKTAALVGLFRARAYVDEGIMGANFSFYTQFTQMIKEMIAGFADHIPTRTALDKYLQIKYFFLDDISKGEKVLDPDKMENQVLRDILLDRWENKRYLICTANYRKENIIRVLRSSFGEYTLSRVMGSSLFLEFPEIDFRSAGDHDKTCPR